MPEVVICGAGPVGLTLAHLLAQDGVEVVVLDRLAATVEEPRAIAFDGESLRTLQKLGLLTGIEQEFLYGLEADYVNGDGQHLFKVGRPDFRPFGYSMINSFDQPALDRYLAAALAEKDGVQLRFGSELTGIEQDESGVRVTGTDPYGASFEINAAFLVGCDGGRSTVRSLLGIPMQGESNPQPWLVIDTEDPQLDGQLDCRFYCDPQRPGMTIRKRHGRRRWEWMLMPGEEREFLLWDDTIAALIAPYTDPAQVNVYRRRVYDFHALLAERWREGRVFLAGDAAHMTPPFAGQGLNSGLRDVLNLGWKLALVVKGLAHNSILDSYERDRREHARELIQTATDLGAQIQPIDPAQAAERDGFFAELAKTPGALEALEDDMGKSLTERRVDPILTVPNATSEVPGKLLIQPVVTRGEESLLLDDCLGTGFALLGVNCQPAQCIEEAVLRRWVDVGASLSAVQSGATDLAGDALVDSEGALAEWLGSSEPLVLLLRPDRFCMACAAPDEADAALEQAYLILTEGPDR